MFKKLFNYINDNKLRISLGSKFIDIENYNDILTFGVDEMIIDCFSFNIIISGNNLNVKKLFGNEVLITGNILGVKFNEH